MQILVTGSGGLIGSQAVEHFGKQGHRVIGIDNNMRRTFFGPGGDVNWNIERLNALDIDFVNCAVDIQITKDVIEIFDDNPIDVVIHCAAQPSHDKASDIPLLDFGVNATGTVNLLEATRLHAPDAAFIFMSTNKVYGDVPNELPLEELATRWDYADPADYNGIDENCRIDQCLHSLFGASKVAADVMVQEYGRYFGMKTVAFRGGCLTGAAHSGVKLHGFLSFLVKTAMHGEQYSILGYKGKQVRDQIHSYDVIRAFECFIDNPRSGEVYNLGGGRDNSASILESIDLIEQTANIKVEYEYVDENRIGDHICYISNLTKLQSHYPDWSITRSLPNIVEEMVRFEQEQLSVRV